MTQGTACRLGSAYALHLQLVTLCTGCAYEIRSPSPSAAHRAGCLSAVCLFLAHSRVSMEHLTSPALGITFLQAKINYGGHTQYQMKKGNGGNPVSRWVQMQRCLHLCHWFSIDNHIKEANGVAGSIAEMFPRGKQRNCPPWQLFKKMLHWGERGPKFD